MVYDIKIEIAIPKSYLEDLQTGGENRFLADRGDFSFDITLRNARDDAECGIGRVRIIPLPIRGEA